MMWRLGLVSFLFLCASLATAHEPVLLDDRRATPGIRLELTELPTTTTAASATARYQLRASGLPRDVVFGIWAKDFGHSFHEMATGFRMDESGAIVSSELDSVGRPHRLDEMVLDPGSSYPRGAVWEVALASVDLTLTAFAKVIPRPITARDGACAVSLELVTRRGDRFVASGAGFPPNEDVITELWYAGRMTKKNQRVSAEGQLPPNVIAHGAIGTDRSARYVVKGRSCNVTVEYEWGEQTLGPY